MLAKLGVKENRLDVIPNGIDIKKWKPHNPNYEQNNLQREIRQKLGNERIFIYMGRIASEKNVEALLRAWRFAWMERTISWFAFKARRRSLDRVTSRPIAF